MLHVIGHDTLPPTVVQVCVEGEAKRKTVSKKKDWTANIKESTDGGPTLKYSRSAPMGPYPLLRLVD